MRKRIRAMLEKWKENDNRINEKRPLKSFSLKVNRNARIDIHLKEGLFEESNHASYITLSIYKEGNKTPIHMKKAQASQLSLLLSQLVAEGNNFDYQRLKSKYPNQESWHIY
jgi:adenine specific DNA methylase Mod